MYYELAKFYKLSSQKLEQRIFQNLKKNLNFNVADGCTKLVLQSLLESDQFLCSEIDIFHSVIAWAETSLNIQNITVTIENIER